MYSTSWVRALLSTFILVPKVVRPIATSGTLEFSLHTSAHPGPQQMFIRAALQPLPSTAILVPFNTTMGHAAVRWKDTGRTEYIGRPSPYLPQ